MAFFDRIKRLASETAVYGLSSIVGRLIGYLLVPIYTNYFDPDRFGVYTQVYVLFALLNVVYAYGMESAYLKFASGTEGRARRTLTFSTSFWLLLGTTVCFSLALVLFQGSVGLAIGLEGPWRSLLYYAAGILALDTLATVPFAELRLQGRALFFAVAKTAGIVLNVILNVVFIIGMGMGIEAIFLANLIASGLTLLVLLPVYRQLLRPTFDGALARELLWFGLPLLPSGLGYVITERISYLFLERMAPERVLALYGDVIPADELALKAEQAAEIARRAAEQSPGLGPAEIAERAADAADGVYGAYVLGIFSGVYKLAVFMMLISQMFRYAWQPFFLQHAEDADAKALFARIFMLFTAVGLLVCLGVSFFMHELVALPIPGLGYLVGREYWAGLYVVPIVLLAYLFQGWYYNFSAGLYIRKQTKYFVHATFVGAAVTLLMNGLLVPRFGMLAAAWSTLVAYMAMAGLLYVYAQRVYPVPYAWGRLFGMCALAAGLFTLWKLVPPVQVWWAELGLLLVFVAGLFALQVIPRHLLRRLSAKSSAPRP